MPALQQHSVWTGVFVGTAGAVAIGTVVMIDASGVYVQVASAANRAAASRTQAVAGITLTAASTNNPSVEIQSVGPCPPSITGLGAGTATNLVVNSAGRLERKASVSSSDIVVGKCDADGWAYLNFSPRTPPDLIDTANSTVTQETVELTTTNDTETQAGTLITLPNNTLTVVDLQVVAFRSGATKAAVFNVRRIFRTEGSTATALDQVDLTGPDLLPELTSFDVAVTAITVTPEGGGNAVKVQVQGLASNTIRWRVDRQVVQVTAP